ncbi:hypothetical protein [Streptomyces sp. BH055]|uniref:hypothetical protein n=1 Tax=Streptomyces sp. BH055 TaxID=3401173 RepID=UPI003BB538A1
MSATGRSPHRAVSSGFEQWQHREDAGRARVGFVAPPVRAVAVAVALHCGEHGLAAVLPALTAVANDTRATARPHECTGRAHFGIPGHRAPRLHQGPTEDTKPPHS